MSRQPTDVPAAIAAHKAAWQAFQEAPADERHPDTLTAYDAETEALAVLLDTVPANTQDVAALREYLDWWIIEEAQRRDMEPQPFALHAAITLAHAADAELRRRAKALVDAVTFDDCGSIVGGHLVGGNGGLLSRETIKAADALRQLLEGAS